MTILSHIKNLVNAADAGSAPRIAVFGDSHTAALLRAQQYSKRTEDYRRIRVYRLRKAKDGKAVGDFALSKFLKEVRSFGPDDFVFSVVGGNQYAIPSTVRSEIDYDLLTDAGDRLVDDGVQVVPLRAMASFIESGVRESVGSVLRQVRAATDARLFHLTPPPPKEDNEFIAAHVDGYFKRLGLGVLGPTHPSLRLKCWKVQLALLQDLCADLDIGLLPPPAGTVNRDGFLKPSCYANDATHANRRYGEAVLKQILGLAQAATVRVSDAR